MLKDFWEDFKPLFYIVPIFCVFTFCVCFFSSYMEAKTYTKLTGKQVTVWEAFWVDLRVMEGVK
jgi:hypothetical protein